MATDRDRKVDHLPSMLDEADAEDESNAQNTAEDDGEDSEEEVAMPMEPKEKERFERWRTKTRKFDAKSIELAVSIPAYRGCESNDKVYHVCRRLMRTLITRYIAYTLLEAMLMMVVNHGMYIGGIPTCGKHTSQYVKSCVLLDI